MSVQFNCQCRDGFFAVTVHTDLCDWICMCFEFVIHTCCGCFCALLPQQCSALCRDSLNLLQASCVVCCYADTDKVNIVPSVSHIPFIGVLHLVGVRGLQL